LARKAVIYENFYSFIFLSIFLRIPLTSGAMQSLSKHSAHTHISIRKLYQ